MYANVTDKSMCFCFFDPFVSDKPWDLSRNGLVQHHIREALSSIKDAAVKTAQSVC